MGITVFVLLLLGCCLYGGQTGEIAKSLTSYDQAMLLAQQSVKLNFLEKKIKALTAALDTIKAKSVTTENNVTALQNHVKVEQVAFSTSLVASGSATFGPYNRFINLVFKHVFTNIGNAYSPLSGFFKAPVKGVYHFEFYIGAHAHTSHPSTAVLVKNGHHICAAEESQKSGFGSSSNAASLLLEVGDVVFLRIWPSTRIFDNTNHLTTFSGHLLFTV